VVGRDRRPHQNCNTIRPMSAAGDPRMTEGELEGRYRILRRLGEGAMGEVHLVENLTLGRKEALKVLHEALGDSPELVARFRREARATNRLQHPNIVCVYDFGRLRD